MKYLLLVLGLCASGCATVHPGNFASVTSNKGNIPLSVSAETIDPDPASPFQLVQVTFENTSNNWVRVSDTEMELDDPSKSHISVVVGSDLKYWAEATLASEKMNQYNRDILISSIALAGAAAIGTGAAKDSLELSKAGTAALVGASAWAAGENIARARKGANQAPLVPEGHLYSPITVPPKLFLRRWVLFNKPEGAEIHQIKFSLETAANEKATYAVPL